MNFSNLEPRLKAGVFLDKKEAVDRLSTASLYSLQNHAQDELIVLYGELAFAAKLFCQVQNALGAEAMTFFYRCGNWTYIAFWRCGTVEGVFHGEQQLSIGITQHQLDLPLLFRELQLSVQGIVQIVGKDGGEHDLVYPQGFQIQVHMECNTGLATLAFEICKNIVEGIILAVATKGCGFHLGYIAGDQIAGVLQIVLIDTQGQIAQQQPHIVAQEAGFQIAFPDGFQFLCLLLNRDFDDPVLLLHLHFRFVFLVVDRTKGDKHHAEEECQKIGDQTGLKRPPVGIDTDGVIKQIVHEGHSTEEHHAAGIFGEELENQTGKIVNNRNGYRCRDDDPHNPDRSGIHFEGFCQQTEPFGRLAAQISQAD